MQISNLRISGFRSFGLDVVDIPLVSKMSTFIGLNSSGKTTALEALRKVFGTSLSEREIYREDFHIAYNEDPTNITNRKLSIEVKIKFTEEESQKDAIIHLFPAMVVGGVGEDPYVRIRLEATWEKSEIVPDGEIEVNTYFISMADGLNEKDEDKKPVPNHLRNLIQILYVPAIRRPSEQIKYASGSILYRILKKIEWNDSFKENFDTQINKINDSFQGLSEFSTIQNSISDIWSKFHKDERYSDTSIGFSNSNFDEILKKIEISFSPTGTHKTFSVNELGDGYRSMFYLTLVCALLEIEDTLTKSSNDKSIEFTRPLLTILAVEEPENHIAPQLLGRVVKILNSISLQENSQVLFSSHTPAIVKRIDPENILHFRITEKYITQVNCIKLPNKADDAYKYIKQAIHNYPEIYFARLVVIGEGDTEEVIFEHLMRVKDLDFDDNIVTFAPLGHRFVSHIWKLLNTLHIPYITLLDLDLEREGGGWGRIKYILQELIEIGVYKNDLLRLENNRILSDKELEEMHTWEVSKKYLCSLNGWVDFLKKYNVFYSAPLDLDFLMLKHYPNFYKQNIPKNGGPRIPDKDKDVISFNKKVVDGVAATLKSENAKGITYSDEEKELMIWYNYHFLSRGKPTTHILTLANIDQESLEDNLPIIFNEIFSCIKNLLNLKDD
ncbi:AAA family ATPase [uncultured Acinetobacter sp.]|uniref:ATP-dependent nuclease n=1 Tax=uncultured Acinetobacter sp. TaxID=165433 RepID=UPI00261D30EF|nr:AAA family ATPase [uncultured Acinetobacter sp.]